MSESNKNILAFEYSGTEIGKDLYLTDLQTDDQIESLFDLSQILRVHITANGWKHLFENFGLYKLYIIDRKSGWHETDHEQGWIKSLLYVSLCTGYNPINKSFGEWSEETNLFTNEDDEFEIDWKHVETFTLKSL
tara:strand:+ start:986 stop:1390 length:405 start_codon:yes stop_codon:yes gene_type:complete